MKRNHKHADMIRSWLDDDSLKIEVRCDEEWKEVSNPFWDERSEYRIKPKMIRIGEFDVPEPLRVAPADNTTYWTVFIDSTGELADKWDWSGGHIDLLKLKRGLCHATREAAELHARALIALTETKIINTEGN